MGNRVRGTKKLLSNYEKNLSTGLVVVIPVPSALRSVRYERKNASTVITESTEHRYR